MSEPEPPLMLDLVWARARARARAHQWWPARVLPTSEDEDEDEDGHVRVSLFSFSTNEDAFSCPADASHLQPFFRSPHAPAYARQAHPAALRLALSFAARSLLSPNSAPAPNFTPAQFLSCLRRAAALSVQAVDLLDSARLLAWVLARALPLTATATATATPTTKRLRKKSKYLSPPYTHTHTHTHNEESTVPPPDALSLRHLFTDFLSTAIDPLYLRRKTSSKPLRLFFAQYRDAIFLRGTHHATFATRQCHCLKTTTVNLKIETDLDINALDSSFNSCHTPKTDTSDLTTGPTASILDNQCQTKRGNDNGPLRPKKRDRPTKEGNCRSSSASSVPILQKSVQNMDSNDFTSSVSSVSSNHIAKGTVLNFARGTCEFLEEARAPMMKACPHQNSYKPDETNKQFQEQSSSKKLKIENTNITSGNGPKHDGGQKQKVAQAHFPNPAALLLDFSKPSAANSNGPSLPSRDQLLSTFSKFGLLVGTQSDVDQYARSACVVFARSADAEAAYNSSDKLGLFGPPFASCRLRYLPPIGANLTPPPSQQLPPLQLAAKPQLSDIRKNLEMMISSLTAGSAVHANGESSSALEGIKPEVRGSLVEKMQGLLMKVEKRLGDCSASSTATLPGVPPP